MKQPIVGLLPVNPHRLHVYWDAPNRKKLFIRIHEAEPEPVTASGSRYVGDLKANQSYQADLYAEGRLLARSNVVTLPPDGPSEPVQSQVAEIAPASP